MSTELYNPLIPGFNPDPSVTKAGGDYYLVTSTFEYLPGLPIYHSTDFVTWKQVGNVATRAEQLGISDVPAGGGVYAPTIRHHDDLFYLIVTVLGGRGCLLFTAIDPAGQWSDGIVVEGLDGIDPDLAWDDDGNAFVTYSAAPLGAQQTHRGIQQVRVDLTGGRILDEPRTLWSGTGLKFPEAPHLYRRGEYWYLIIAEGGTERGHGVSVARSCSPQGPFEPGPSNPFLSARSTDRPIQNTGHGDLVELPDGSTGMVLLGMRPRGLTHGFSPLGRETFATRVSWVDAWPVADPVTVNLRPEPIEYHDTFSTATLDDGWIAVRRRPAEVASLADGALAITGDGTTPDDLRPCLIGRRQVSVAATVSVEVDVTRGTGGCTVLFDQHHHYDLEASAIPGGTRVVGRARVAGIRQEWETILPAGPVVLLVETVPVTPRLDAGMAPDRVRLSAMPRDEPRSTVLVADLDGRYLSAEVAFPFVGRVLGLYATSGTVTFRSYTYQGWDTP
ncbi:beta-xylosidase [Actinoplanes lutulentus]|uniref:Beta-xylosidase n=1 Tax=Actinoplanes lutulentus TaxID=1287878 RepID=A0A327ZGF0_9ACTN|nr:glycoside hydrolase family 43 protein [Actinoplanes lutulentus]MBB2947329.1 beta-xylosidase [Actinoplanes lutulentus]RAK36604.1 beta-xylosidase [Actinoplanes lutulentus]